MLKQFINIWNLPSELRIHYTLIHIHEHQQLDSAWQEMMNSLKRGDLLLLIGAGNIDQLRSKINQSEQNVL